MNVLQFAFYFAGFLYSILYDARFFYIYLAIIGIYCAFHFAIPAGKFNGSRRKVCFAIWNKPYESNIYHREQVDLTQTLQFLEKLPKENKITMTVLTIKAMALAIESA